MPSVSVLLIVKTVKQFTWLYTGNKEIKELKSEKKVKIKLSLCLTKRHAMKNTGGMEV
jgi:hypothetical protein